MKPKQATQQPTMMQRMMSTSFPNLVDPHSYWFVILLVMATLLNKNLVCYAGEVTCAALGCFTPFNSKDDCHCDVYCREHENCCDDFVDCEKNCQTKGCESEYYEPRDCQCNDRCRKHENCCRLLHLDHCEKATCQRFGCGAEYYKPRICQCNDRCHEHKNCCRDYNVTCAFNEQTTDNVSLLQSTTVESTKEAFNEQTTDNVSLLQSTTVESTKEGPKALVVLAAASVLLVAVSIIVLVVCVTLRSKRTHRATEETDEQRNYYEVGNSNERSYELIDGEENRYERTISTSSITGNDTQFVENVAYESYR